MIVKDNVPVKIYVHNAKQITKYGSMIEIRSEYSKYNPTSEYILKSVVDKNEQESRDSIKRLSDLLREYEDEELGD